MVKPSSSDYPFSTRSVFFVPVSQLEGARVEPVLNQALTDLVTTSSEFSNPNRVEGGGGRRTEGRRRKKVVLFGDCSGFFQQ